MADIPYSLTLDTTFYVCTPNDSDIKDDACVSASHGWQQIDITVSAFELQSSVSLVCHTVFPMFS